MKKSKIIRSILVLCFIATIGFSGYKIWKINADYYDEKRMHDIVMEYKPEDPKPDMEIINQSVIDLQSKYSDVVGWLTVPNTKIDYPFVWYENNDYYLRRDLNGDYALAGTVFMDYRCEKGFTSKNTIIYGHHMRNNSMFGTIKLFNDKDFFDKNRIGTIYLPYATLTLEFFAYMVVNPDTEKEIYHVSLNDTYFDYVKNNARHYRDVGLTTSDKIVTLSTCAYEFKDARMVLIGVSKNK